MLSVHMTETELGLPVDPAEEYTHPKILAGWTRIEAVPQITIEEGEKDRVRNIDIWICPAEGDLEQLEIELTSEDDIYSVRRAVLTVSTFPEFRKEQRLRKTETFPGFVECLKTVLKNVATNRSTFRATFEEGHLVFRQQLEFKTVKIFSIEFSGLGAGDEYVKKQAQFRFTEKQHLLNGQLALLKDLFRHVESKNAIMAQQVRKGSKFGYLMK
jgi:hypothetical protein